MEQDPTQKKNYSVLIVALLAAFLPLLATILQVRSFAGRFIYPVDDAYIHLQLAKNLAQHGTWGVNPGSFGSASSSLLYTLILAALSAVFGASAYLPLAVNSAAAIVLLVALHRWLREQGLGAGAQLLALLLIIFFTPVPVLVLSGMEHTLQCLFSFLFLAAFGRWMNSDAPGPLPRQLVLWAVLTATIRYEGLFLVGAACLALAWRRRWTTAFILGAISAVPVLLFGIYSVAKGSYFLPNSVLIKSGAAGLSGGGLVSGIGRIIIEKFTVAASGITLLATQRLLILLALVFLVFAPFIRRHRGYCYFLLPLALAAAAHLALADTGKFYRYEAYLVLCSVAITVVLLVRAGSAVWSGQAIIYRIVLVGFAGLLALPLVMRSAAAFAKSKRACLNIYEQQYQMAQFVHRYHASDGLAANDIGAVSYFNQVRLLDLWGLASIDVARSRQRGYWGGPYLDSLARNRHIKLAIVYDSWMPRDLLSRWTKVGTWIIPDNVVCGDDTVSFYAIDPLDAPQLKKELLEYQPLLPHEVSSSIYP